MKIFTLREFELVALCALGALASTALAAGPPPPWAKNWKEAPKSGPLATAPPGAYLVGDHWHTASDFGAVLHGERWGCAGRLGTWKSNYPIVPRAPKK